MALVGGSFLAAIAGFVNVVTITAAGVPVTHVTGTMSRLSHDVGKGDIADLASVLPLAAAFALGAAISGVIVGGHSLRLGRRYGVAMLLEAGLFTATALLLRTHADAAILLASAGAGLQNAMASTYGGLIVRTTHMTGILTDLGAMVGEWLRHRRVEPWKFALLGGLLLSFFGGGVAGAIAGAWLGSSAMWIPAGMLGVCGASYLAWRVRAQHHL